MTDETQQTSLTPVPYVRFDPSSGEIIAWGNCMPADLELQGDNTLAGTGDPSTACVASGAIVAYTVDQAAAKAANPNTLGIVWSNASMAWIDTRDLATCQASQWAIIVAARDTANYSGFTWNNGVADLVFDSDADSQARIQGAAVLALMAQLNSQPYSEVWTLADNSTTTLDASQMIEVGVALGVCVRNAYDTARTLRVALDAATTPAQALAAVWPPAG